MGESPASSRIMGFSGFRMLRISGFLHGEEFRLFSYGISARLAVSEFDWSVRVLIIDADGARGPVRRACLVFGIR